VRQRRLRRLLRVTFPDGKVLCYKSATMTFVETLQMIETDRLPEVKLESYHLPLLSQEIYPRFEEWMKPIKDGLYVNVQSDSDQKYMQLVSILNQLGLNWKVEVGSDFTPSNNKVPQRKKREVQRSMVKFPDGTKGKPLITPSNQYKGQIEICDKRWLAIPPQTKDKLRTLIIIRATMHLNIVVIMRANQKQEGVLEFSN